jgi:hypothetical protein
MAHSLRHEQFCLASDWCARRRRNTPSLARLSNGLEMLDESALLIFSSGIIAGKAVFIRAPLQIVPGCKVLGVDPGQPGRGIAASSQRPMS